MVISLYCFNRDRYKDRERESEKERGKNMGAGTEYQTIKKLYNKPQNWLISSFTSILTTFFLFSLSYSGRKFIAINANSIEYRDAENPWKLFRFVNEIEIGEMVGTGELDTRVHTSVC